MSPFWMTYHALMDYEDDDGLPSPLMHDAAHWMNECYLALREAANTGSHAAKCATYAIHHSPRIFPLKEHP